MIFFFLLLLGGFAMLTGKRASRGY